MEKSNIRNSNIEFLRIVSMLLILFHHYAVHSGFNFEFTGQIISNKIFIDILSSFGKAGVNIFLAISSYYLIDLESKSKFKIKKY